ncbi:MAG: DNA-protecting protein DprA [Betaproteobacteria bacterium]|nr:DNA-protecting protein DprA [Betaproteobacteria bacterium]
MTSTSPACEDWPDWLRLTNSPGVSGRQLRQLLQAFGGPTQVFAASEAARAQCVGDAAAAALSQPSADAPLRRARTEHWLAHPAPGVSHRLWTLGDADYPSAFLQLSDPPLMLYVQGQAQKLEGPALAVVGSRNPTAQGRENALAFADNLAASGICIVSGLALGIDAAAHEGALRGAQHTMATVAVVGTGLDRVYPKANQALAQAIALQGCLISEYPLGAAPMAAHFPQRNRLIAALGQGCLVVEAALSSGSLITANQALELGREVFAIPGSIHSPQSRGCHALIRQGAKLVESAQDVWDELRAPGCWRAQTESPIEPSAPEDTADPVLKALGWEPCGLDQLQARCGWDTATLQAHLLALELAHQISRLSGGRFQRQRLA